MEKGLAVIAPVPTVAAQMLFGVPIAPLRIGDVIRLADAAIARDGTLRLGVVNAAKIVNMRNDPALRASVLDTDLILADGISVVWASRLLGRPLPERVTGIDLMTRLLELANEHGYAVFLFGAAEDVLNRVVERVKREFPTVRIAGARNGYFRDEEQSGIADQIRTSGADILLVAISSPTKELFLSRWGESLGVPVCHGVGGSFDVMAGKVRRAPRLWQRLGLEWLYRVYQEPRRLWKRYLVTNTAFAWLVFREYFGRRSTV